MGMTPKRLAPIHWLPARPKVKEVVTPVVVVRYKRFGLCNQCGQCCAGTDPFALIQNQCSQLHYDEENARHICGVHQTDNQFWVGACDNWPRKPSDIWQYPKCSFSFVVDDDAVPD